MPKRAGRICQDRCGYGGTGACSRSARATETATAEAGGLFIAPRNGVSDAWRPLIDPHFIIAAVRSWKAPIIGLGMLGAALGVMTALSTPKFYYASRRNID